MSYRKGLIVFTGHPDNVVLAGQSGHSNFCWNNLIVPGVGEVWRMRSTQIQPPGVGGTAQVYIEQYTPLKGVGVAARSDPPPAPPLSALQVPSLVRNRLPCLIDALLAFCTHVLINSVPWMSQPVLVRQF